MKVVWYLRVGLIIQARSKHSIAAESMQMLGGNGSANDAETNTFANNEAVVEAPVVYESKQPQVNTQNNNEEAIPF